MPILAQSDDEGETRIFPHIEAIRAILETDVFEDVMGSMLREYCNEHLQKDQELFSEVHNRLASDKIISKANFRALWNK